MKKTRLLIVASALCLALAAASQTNAPTPGKHIMKRLGLTGKTLKAEGVGAWSLPDGGMVYASHPFCSGIKGFKGPTPLYIAVSKTGRITAIAPDRNSETQSVWAKVQGSHLFKSWNGRSLKSAATAKVDAVSGATYSSTAVIRTVKATAEKFSK